MSAPQPIAKGPGRRGGASASSGRGQAGFEHPAAPDLPARTWRPSGPLRELRCCFSWPWRGSRRWQGACPRAVRVRNCWSSGSGRSGAAASALQDGAGLGAGGRATPGPGPRPVTREPEVPAGGAGCRGGTSEDLSPPSLSPPRRAAERAAVTHVRGLALSPAGPGTQLVPDLLTRLGSVSEKGEMPSPRIVARVGWVSEVQHPTAALTSYCCLTLAGFRKADLGRRASTGPTACRVQAREENGPQPSRSACAVVCRGCLCVRDSAGLAGLRTVLFLLRRN